MTSSGGDAALSQKLSPLAVDPCKGVANDVARGTAVASVRSPGVTVIGMTHVRANIAVTGHDALLVGRLWDVNPATGHQRLVDRGVVRLRSRKLVSFDLNGNAYKFARGHQIKLELLGRDSPTYRAANGDVQRDGEAAEGGAADAGATARRAELAARSRAREGAPTCIAASTIPTHVSVASATWTHTISAGSSRWYCTMPIDALRGEQQADARQARAQLGVGAARGARATRSRPRARRARGERRRGGR